MLSGPRMPRWRFNLLDGEDRHLRELRTVTGGSGEIVAADRLGGSASLTLDDDGQPIDWMQHRVQAVYDPGIQGVDAWEFGTYLFTSPVEQHTAYGLTFEVGLLTKMSIIDEDTTPTRYTVIAGTPIIKTVTALIESTGETRIAATQSDAVLVSDMTWDAGTSKLTVINSLLQAAGYWALWCDGAGQYRVEPYQDPAQRAPAWEFVDGEDALHLPDWGREYNQSSVPNRFIAVGQGDEETEPLIGVAANTNPASPYSHQARGRWITVTEEGVEGETQAQFDAYAARRLRDQMSPVSRLTATHAVLPLNPNDVVAFTPSDGVRRQATVQRMTVTFTFDTDCAAEWREVLPL